MQDGRKILHFRIHRDAGREILIKTVHKVFGFAAGEERTLCECTD